MQREPTDLTSTEFSQMLNKPIAKLQNHREKTVVLLLYYLSLALPRVCSGQKDRRPNRQEFT